METEWEETGETESGNQCKQSTKWRGKRVAELVIMGGVATDALTLATPVLHAEQPLLQQLFQKIKPWGCPGPGPPGTCRRLPR